MSNCGLFQYMEEPLIESLREKMWDDFHEHEEVLYRRLFHWMQTIMSSECKAIEYKLIPGE